MTTEKLSIGGMNVTIQVSPKTRPKIRKPKMVFVRDHTQVKKPLEGYKCPHCEALTSADPNPLVIFLRDYIEGENFRVNVEDALYDAMFMWASKNCAEIDKNRGCNFKILCECGKWFNAWDETFTVKPHIETAIGDELENTNTQNPT
jgi:hypothetical protein